MNDGPEKKQFIVTRYYCTNCKWFKKTEPGTWPNTLMKTDCTHPAFGGPFPYRSLGQEDITPNWCPYLVDWGVS